MNKRTILMTSAVTAALVLAPTASAQAASKPQIDLDGQGTYTIGTDGAAAVSGSLTGGRPFSSGQFTGQLRAADGTLPVPGECEPGSASVRVEDLRGRYVTLDAQGNVCGHYVQPPYVVTHAFTGRYDVGPTSSPERRLRGGDGFLEIRLANDGRAGFFAIDT